MWEPWDFCFQVLFLAAAAAASERSDTRLLLTDNAGGGYASFSCRFEPSQLCVCWLYLESFRSKIN